MSPALLREISRVAYHDALDALHRGDAATGTHLYEHLHACAEEADYLDDFADVVAEREGHFL